MCVCSEDQPRRNNSYEKQSRHPPQERLLFELPLPYLSCTPTGSGFAKNSCSNRATTIAAPCCPACPACPCCCCSANPPASAAPAALRTLSDRCPSRASSGGAKPAPMGLPRFCHTSWAMAWAAGWSLYVCAHVVLFSQVIRQSAHLQTNQVTSRSKN